MLEKMRFSNLLCAANEPSLDDFRRWVFRPGMLFQSPNKWWGDLGQRDFPHEGVDFCLYENVSGRTLQLTRRTRIPALFDGVVRQIFSDYLGQAILVEHDIKKTEHRKMVSLYAHTEPAEKTQTGVFVKQGDIIANIADTRSSTTPIFPHLHYTLGQVSTDLDYGTFAWDDMRDSDLFLLLNPFDAISDPCQASGSF